jgi:protein gp37
MVIVLRIIKENSMTKIQWTDETANWIVGCTKIRAKGAKQSGCDNCYAATAANSARLQQFDQYKAVVDGNGNWNGNIEFVPKVLDGLLKGKRSRRVFAPSMSDPFHPGVKTEWLDQFIATAALTPHITYQVLTKRPEPMYEYITNLLTEERFRPFCNDQAELLAAKKVSWPKCVFDPKTDVDEDDDLEACLEIHLFDCLQQAFEENTDSEPWADQVLQNLHLGVSVENQAAADERIPWLIKTPAKVRFLSMEPLIEPVFLGRPNLKHIDWVIVGGESGKNARKLELNWVRAIQDECFDLGVKYFFKQAGSNVWDGGRQLKLRDRKGGDMAEWPEDLRIREIL